MVDRTPLPTSLSQVLVAFTIELDNEFEARMPHATTIDRATVGRPGPWLVSLPMWANFMRLLPPEGRKLRDLRAAAEITNLGGLERWGYVTIDSVGLDEPVVRPTEAGAQAQDVWRPLAGEIEQRWRTRLGDDAVDELRDSLGTIADQLEFELPHYLPIAAARRRDLNWPPRPASAEDAADLDLTALLARVLLAFTIDFERDSRLTLATSANALRVLGPEPVRRRDLPALTGVSREAVAVYLGHLERLDIATVESDSDAARAKVVRLTPKGERARAKYARVLTATERDWRDRYGDRLRAALEPLLAIPSPLAAGLEPHPDGWRNRHPYVTQTRAVLRDPASALPHYPAVSHRDGFPDGS